MSKAIRNIVGFNVLYVSTICTLSVFIGVVLSMCAQWLGIVHFRLDVRSSAVGLANFVGLCAAIGAALAAISPLLVDKMMRGSNASGPVTPSLLLDFPATFAAVGYILGVVYLPFNLCKNSKNLIYRWWLPTIALTVGFGIIVFYFRVDPHGLFKPTHFFTEVTDDVCKAKLTLTQLNEYMDDPVRSTMLFDMCGKGVFLSGWHIFAGALVYSGAISFVQTGREYFKTVKLMRAP